MDVFLRRALTGLMVSLLESTGKEILLADKGATRLRERERAAHGLLHPHVLNLSRDYINPHYTRTNRDNT